MSVFDTILLSQAEVQSLITMKDVVEAVDKTFKGFGEGTTINPVKVGLDLGETAAYPPYEGFMNAMPAYVGWLDSAGIKWAGGFLGERKRMGLPYVTSLIMLIDPRVGNFRAVMDGAHITNLRTGAQTAVALKYMTSRKSLRIGLYGAGMQGRTQIMAISELFEIEELVVYDVSEEALEKYRKDMAGYIKNEIKLAGSPEEAAVGDAVICVTQAKDKFVKNDWIKPGTILFPMGSYQECDDDFILSADKIIVDHVGQCLHRGALKALSEAGKINESSLYATIGELAAGKKSAPDMDSERVLCIPIGTGAMDIAVGTIALKRAQEKGIGGSYSFA